MKLRKLYSTPDLDGLLAQLQPGESLALAAILTHNTICLAVTRENFSQRQHLRRTSCLSYGWYAVPPHAPNLSYSHAQKRLVPALAGR